MNADYIYQQHIIVYIIYIYIIHWIIYITKYFDCIISRKYVYLIKAFTMLSLVPEHIAYIKKTTRLPSVYENLKSIPPSTPNPLPFEF